MKRCDLAIIGGGPAGLSAAITAASEGLSTVLFNSESHIGGQSKYSSAIENYLGFPTKISGQQLAARAAKQAKKFGADLKTAASVNWIEPDGDEKVVRFTQYSKPNGNGNRVLVNDEIVAKSIIIACGLSFRGTGAKNESEFVGRGVMYNADKNMAHFFKGKKVLIVGGGNSAGQAALHWKQFADVSIAVRSEIEGTMSSYLVDRIKGLGIPVRVGSELKEVNGDKFVELCQLSDGEMPCDAVLPFVGSEPRTEFARGVCECDEKGFLIGGKIAGVFIAGDCRLGSVKRIAAAVGEGAGCVPGVHKFLAGLPGKEPR